MKLVAVTWEDASEADDGPWVDVASAPEAEVVVFRQVGFLYRMTAAEVVLTAVMGAHQMGPRTRIPAGMVRSIVELTPGAVLALPKTKRKPQQ